MTINVVKFSQFAAGNLANANYLVGVTSLSGGTNFNIPAVNTWGTAGRPSMPVTGTLGYNSDLGQYEFWNGAAWVQLAAGGSGTVGLGAANEIAYYEFSGTAVTGLLSNNNSILKTSNTGVPSMSTTAPAGLTIPQPIIQGFTDGTSAAAGVVGEVIKSVIPSASSISLSSAVAANITSITLTAGDWDIFGSAAVTDNGGGGGFYAQVFSGISLTSATLPDYPFLLMLVDANFDTSYFGGAVPGFPVSISTNTTYYLVTRATIGSGGVLACGTLYARRRR